MSSTAKPDPLPLRRALPLLLRFFLLAAAVFCFHQPASAQYTPPVPMIFVTVDPAGVCGTNVPLRYNTSNGKLWGCDGGTWTLITGSASGSVTSVSVVSANGLSGTVANPTTTPALTLTSSHGFTATFGSRASGASVLTTQTIYPTPLPVGFTITTCEIQTVPADTATFTVWRIASPGTAVPTVANLINTSGISISTGSLLRTTSLSDFTSLVMAAGDALAINITAIGGTATYASFSCHN